MRRRHAPVFGSAWTRTAAATLLVAIVPAAIRAEQGSGAPSAAATAHKAAADRFEALAKDAEVTGRMPRRGDLGVANLLDTLADAVGIYGTPKFPARLAEIGVCLDVRKALVRYSLHGLRAELPPSTTSAESAQAVRAGSARNIVAYQDEIAQLAEFDTRCRATLTPELEAVVATHAPQETTTERRDGLRKLRIAIGDVAAGEVLQLGTAGLQPDNRDRLLAVMLTHLPVSVRAMTHDERRALARRLVDVKASAPSTSGSKIDALVGILSSTDCAALCRF